MDLELIQKYIQNLVENYLGILRTFGECRPASCLVAVTHNMISAHNTHCHPINIIETN